LMHYLGAANAAQKQNSDERRDHYLQQAHQEVPKADFVIRLTQAEQLVSQQQFSEALEILNPLREERSNHPKLLQLLAQSLSALQQWKALLQLIPRLRKTEEVDLDELNQLELLAENHLLTQSADKGGKGALQKQWKLLSRRQRHQPELVYHYATLLIRAGEKESAETLLRKEIQHQWSEQLVTLYGSFSTDTPDQQIHIAEKWLEQHADSAALQLTLGRLLMQEQVWGAAQQHLERSLKIHPSSAVYQALAQLMKQNQDLAAALHYYEAEVALLRGKTEPPHSTAISVVTDYDSLPSEAPATSNESK
ncbi:MAG: hypothetical protein HN344_10390, partial [Gammaproteobacteria bacterium]|nr:hypothetical protein [Gammaproteobacteria bacterium]